MPEVTSCPDCAKKLKVPDKLIGKKVRCPGCTTMFTARADGTGGGDFEMVDEEQEESSAKVRSGASRKDAISDRKGSRRDEEEDRPSKKSKHEEDEPRRRRDEEDERDRERSRTQGVTRLVEVDDRPSRSLRDEDDRSSRHLRREEDEDHERRPRRGDEAKGWRGMRIGIFLVVIANWVLLGTCGLSAVGFGLMMFFSASLIMDVMGGGGDEGGFGHALGSAIMLMLLFVVVIGLKGISTILELIGMGLCIQVPTRKGWTMRIMAIVSFALCCAGFVLGTGNRTLVGNGTVDGLCGLLTTAGFICFIILLRMAANELGDESLGAKFLFFMIAYFVFFTGAVIMLIVAFCGGIGMAASGRDAGDVAARLGTMVVVTWTLGLLSLAIFCGLITWYSVLLQRLRGLITSHAGE